MEIITEIRQILIDLADEKLRKSSDRFFKEGEKALVYGIKMSEVNKIGKEFCKRLKNCSKEEIFEICEELWKSKYLEEAVIACVLTKSLHQKYEPEDFQIFAKWIKNYVNNWADCDTFCNHTVGNFLMKFPEFVAELKKMAKSVNRWEKRASAVSLIIPARKGMFLSEILEIAEILLLDNDDLVQKGYGWMLKAASMTEKFIKSDEKTKKEHLEAVFNFIMKHKAVMPRTALRYAIEKMPQDLRKIAMQPAK